MSAKPFIKKLRISNYKSISDLVVRDIGAFAVFAGANGSGKSNFFDALKFVSDFVRFGVTEALKLHGGWETIHSVKLRKENASTLYFEIEIEMPVTVNDVRYKSMNYELSISNLHSQTPQIKEKGWYDDKLQFTRYPESEYLSAVNNVDNFTPTFGAVLEDYSKMYGEGNGGQPLMVWWDTSELRRLYFMHLLIKSLQIYRIDPLGAKLPSPMDADSSGLHSNGHNLAAVLHRIEKENNAVGGSILDIMSDVVPQLEGIHTDKEKFRMANFLTFKEKGTRKEFPAHLISDGTVFALSLLIAVLDRPSLGLNWTLIEEPERGLHPHAIVEIIDVFRDGAGQPTLQPVWITTHNASLIRCCKPEELFFVEKDGNGNTIIKKPLMKSPLTLPLDEAWLSNVLDGGLPW